MDSICVCLTVLFAIVQVTSCKAYCSNYYLIMEETTLGTQFFLEPLASNAINWGEFSDADEIKNCTIGFGCIGIETTCENNYNITPNYGPDEYVETNSSWLFPFNWFKSITSTTTTSSYATEDTNNSVDTVEGELVINENCSQGMAEFISINQCTKILNFTDNNTYMYDCQISGYNECEDAVTETQLTNVNRSETSGSRCTNNYIIIAENLLDHSYLEPFKMNNIIDWSNIVHVNETSCFLELGCIAFGPVCVKAYNIQQLHKNREFHKETNPLIRNAELTPSNENSVDMKTTLDDLDISHITLSPLTAIFDTLNDDWLEQNEDFNDDDMTTEAIDTSTKKGIKNTIPSKNYTEVDEDSKSDDVNHVTLEELTINIDTLKGNCTLFLHFCDKIANLSQKNTYLKCKYVEESCTPQTNIITLPLKTVNGKTTDTGNAMTNNIAINSTLRNNQTDDERDLIKLNHDNNNLEKNVSSVDVFKHHLNNTPIVLNKTTVSVLSTTTINNNITSAETIPFESSTKFNKHESTESDPIEALDEGTPTTMSPKVVLGESSEFGKFESTTHNNEQTSQPKSDKELYGNNEETGAYSKERDNDHTLEIYLTVFGAVVFGTLLYFIATKINDALKSGQYRVSEHEPVNPE